MARFARVLLVLVCSFGIASILRATLPLVPSGEWADSGLLAQARTGAAAVLLADGRVLITGGDVNGVPSSSAEFFNIDGSITSAASMSTARSGHSALLLPSGQVLVTGGITSGGGVTNSAELYDPVDDLWYSTGTMQDARFGHKVIQMPDWTILVVGGMDANGSVTAVERYSPDENAFVHAGVLSQARSDAAVTRLDDGRIFIAGGVLTGQTLATNSTEIFDPATGSSARGPMLSSPRAAATATTLFDGRIAIIGGNDGTRDLASAEIYDPASDAFTVVEGITPRSHHLAVSLPYNNSVLVTGGTGGNATDFLLPWANGDQGALAPVAASRVPHSGGFAAPLAIEGLLLAGAGQGTAATELFRFATIKTDRDDYVPGETVTISGAGWKPGEQVTINLVESPNIDAHPAIIATADANGKILDSSFTTDLHDFQVRFFVTAHGSASDAATSFTDGGGAVQVSGVSSTTNTGFSYTGYSDSACNTVAGGQGQNFPKLITITGNTSANLGLGNANFFKLTIPADPAGFRFTNWSNAASGTSRTTGCIPVGSGSNTATAQANFVVSSVATTLTIAVSPVNVEVWLRRPGFLASDFEGLVEQCSRRRFDQLFCERSRALSSD